MMESKSTPIKIWKMDIFDNKNKRRNICIIQQCNCIRRKPHGLSLDFVKNLGGYANAYNRRMGKHSNTASVSSRPKCGEIGWSSPPFHRELPHIVHFYSQFDSGLSIESNNASLEYGYLKDDVHFQDNKRLDTKANRVIYFEKCLEKLAEQLNGSMSSTISEVLFPYRIGCGKAGGSWEAYFASIVRFDKKVKQTVKIAHKIK